MSVYTIVIIDDEEWIREGILSKVKKSGFPFTKIGEAANAEQGLKIITEMVPDIVVCDIRMEDMDGLELIRIVHQRFPHIKTIVISGYTEFQYATKALKLKVTDYLLKPIDKYALYQAFTKCMEAIEQEKQVRDKIEQLELVGSSTEVKNKIEKILQNEGSNPQAIFSNYNERASFQSIALYMDPQIHLEEKYIVDHLLNQSLFLQLNHNLVCYSRKPNEFMILICMPTPQQVNEYEQYITNFIERIQEDLLHKGIYQYTFGISGFHQSIHTCIFAAIFCMKHRVLLDDNQVIRYADTLEFRNVYKLPTQIKSFLKHHIETQNMKSITSILNDIHTEIGALKISLRCIQNLYNHLLLIATEDFDLELEDDINHYARDVYGFSSSREMLDVIMELYMKIINITRGRSGYSMNQSILKVKEYIDDHYAEDIKLEDLAVLQHYNPSYLSLMFKEVLNINFQDYLLQVRMNHAKKLLLSQQYKVKDIAPMIGFKNPHYFSAVFKKTEGFTPKDFVRDNEHG